MILGIIYLIVAEKLAEWIKMGYGLYEFTVWNKKNCKIHTIRTRKLFLKDGNRYLLRVRILP